MSCTESNFVGNHDGGGDRREATAQSGDRGSGNRK